jgi:hypothetical protein
MIRAESGTMGAHMNGLRPGSERELKGGIIQ